ncbi:MAG: YdcF family protein [Humidesulfovibrio sp.]|uniref:YdcF family protein n=1 Tax=Humidesulfovibrio sp. TaxID=2910988 RepID=UPI0027F7A351|nr:YdcF family protein [Humidesulfovibrio sp.]MDQ7835231.1 YdcF family protein [Humidesulfovibrio sp.]
MKRYLALFLQAVGALTLLGLMIGTALVLTAGWWLRMDDQPRKADAIVILAGDIHRAIYAADLYHQGMAPVIMLGRPYQGERDVLCDLGFSCKTQIEAMEQVLRAKGVPPGVLQLFGKDHMSTVEEGESLARELGPEPKTLLVVTSPYHCRRAKMILSGILRQHELIMPLTPYERFDKIWWRHQGSASAVVSEVAKFVFHYLGTPFRAHPAAAN